MVPVLLTLLFLQLSLVQAGWGSGKGWSHRAHSGSSYGGRWQNWNDGSQRIPFQPQTVRIEVDHVGQTSSRRDRKAKKDKKRRRSRSMSTSSSSCSPSLKGRCGRRHASHAPSLDTRLQAELEALRKEKAEREAQIQKDALLAEVRAITAEAAKHAASSGSGAGSKTGTKGTPEGCDAPSDQLTPPDRMAVFHTLDCYDKVKKATSWQELEESLGSEEESVLKDLYRKVWRRGGSSSLQACYGAQVGPRLAKCQC